MTVKTGKPGIVAVGKVYWVVCSLDDPLYFFVKNLVEGRRGCKVETGIIQLNPSPTQYHSIKITTSRNVTKWLTKKITEYANGLPVCNI